MIREQKAKLRQQISEGISALSDEYIAASDEGIYLSVASTDIFAKARNIMIYYSVKREPATLKLASTALSMGKTVAFPLCYRGGIMQARAVLSLDDLLPAMLGIPAPPDTSPLIAPDELDLIIVPALTYDIRGFRLGYGGGYYDRYLMGISAYTIGIGRERLIKERLPTDTHDIAVNCVATEERILCLIHQKK